MNMTNLNHVTSPHLPTELALIVACIMFCIGLIGVLKRRNIIFIFMSIEVMFNSAGLAFIAASQKTLSVDGQLMFLFILTVAAAEVSVALALILKVFNQVKTLDVNVLGKMKG
jgi:NADH-quinone oxidoreductase subunit K